MITLNHVTDALQESGWVRIPGLLTEFPWLDWEDDGFEARSFAKGGRCARVCWFADGEPMVLIWGTEIRVGKRDYERDGTMLITTYHDLLTALEKAEGRP